MLSEVDLPLPDIAPVERWIYSVGQTMPFGFRHTNCPVTGKKILSRWAESGSVVSVCSDWFWSDECDNCAAGRDYDFSRPFFSQFIEVAQRSYAQSINRLNCEDSPYVNACVGLKSCHLCFACEQLQDSIYCAICSKSNDLLLCSGVSESELCYACLDCENVYGSRFLQDCRDCSNCYWCLDCIGCSNCFQCCGLRQARSGYYIHNEKVSEAEWTDTLARFDFGSFAGERKINQLWNRSAAASHTYDTNFHNEDCSLTYHTQHSKRSCNAMYSSYCEDCKDIIYSTHGRDCYSCVWARDAERCYMLAGGANAYNCFLSDGALGNAKNLFYSLCCYNGCEDLFGCFFLKRKRYCILNKQYSKSEYFDLRARIISHMKTTGEWGKFFPTELYGTPYQDSWAYFFFTELDDEQIRQRGLLASDSRAERVIDSGIELPDNIADCNDELCDKEIRCMSTGRPFGIGKREIKAFRKHEAPLLREHWSRAITRMQRRSIDRCKEELELF